MNVLSETGVWCVSLRSLQTESRVSAGRKKVDRRNMVYFAAFTHGQETLYLKYQK